MCRQGIQRKHSHLRGCRSTEGRCSKVPPVQSSSNQLIDRRIKDLSPEVIHARRLQSSAKSCAAPDIPGSDSERGLCAECKLGSGVLPGLGVGIVTVRCIICGIWIGGTGACATGEKGIGNAGG